jgi:hypothetical protein
MHEPVIASTIQYVEEVLRIAKKWFPTDRYPEIWYRGVCNRAHKLLPGAYWRKPCDEYSLVLTFRAQAPLLVPVEPADGWEWYILMQHYGLPTRMLDWTESPLHGLHFALHEEPGAMGPCVWVMDPVALNVFGHGPKMETVCVPTDDLLSSPYTYWLPQHCGRHVSKPFRFGHGSDLASNDKPIAIYPKRSNPRIFAQRGVFTVHGKDETPIDDVGVKNAAGEERLACIRIAAGARTQILDELWALGFNETATYPEATSVAADIKRMYGLVP